MTPITERLRESYTPGQERRPELDNEAADLIDDLVAALENAIKLIEWEGMQPDAIARAALAKAKGKQA